MVFTVSCPDCKSEFPVDSAKVPAGGVLAQCSACPGTFFVEEPQAQTSAPAEQDTAELDTAEWLEAVGSDTEPVVAEAPETDASPWLETTAQPGNSPTAAVPVEVGSDATQGHDAFAGFEDDGEAQSSVAAEPAEPETAVGTAPAFGQSDPDARAARLARVLVSDMMTYNPALYEKAMEAGTLAEDFEDEVKRSWSEYVEQVGDDVARSTPHFTRALNDILAKGEDVFQQSMYE